MKKKKLQLSRETIARLADTRLGHVIGGGADTRILSGRPDCPIGQGSYVHQTQVYACNKSCDC